MKRIMRNTLYCPSCGEYSEYDSYDFTIIPRVDNIVVCPLCGTVWRITMEFYEIEGEET